MGADGHPPTNGAVAKATFALGQGKCPRCRADADSLEATPDLEPAGSSTVTCPVCDYSHPVSWLPDVAEDPDLVTDGGWSDQSRTDEGGDERIPEDVAEVAAELFFHQRYPDAGEGWQFGDSPLLALPSNREDGLWFVTPRDGHPVDALYPERFAAYSSLAEHLARLDEFVAAGRGRALDLDESPDRERGLE